VGSSRLRVRDIVRETPWSAVVRLDLGTSTFRFRAGQAANSTDAEPVSFRVTTSQDAWNRFQNPFWRPGNEPLTQGLKPSL